MRIGAGLYILSAVMVPEAATEGYRNALRELLLTKQHRLHWRDEGAQRRIEITHAIAALGATSFTVVGTGLHSAKQRRARRKCMERLFWHLAQRSVVRAVMEGRGAVGNREDLDMVNALRAHNAMPEDMHVDWVDPGGEELLWLPDAIAGIIALAEIGDATFRTILVGDHRIERLHCD